MTLNWVVAGGGTGGHITPALAIGEALKHAGQQILFMGSERGLETKLVPDAGFDLVALASGQVMGRGLLGSLRGGLAILSTVARARRELIEFRADIVVSVGGYAAMPAILAAILTRTPLVLVEPNAIPGRVNRLTSRFAKRVFPGFEAAATHLGNRDRCHFLGIPLRESLVAAFPENATRRKAEPPFRVLVFGGSQGARQINEAMICAAKRLCELQIEVFHATGEADRDRVDEAYRKAGVPAEVVVFERDLPSRYLWADIAICRSGALTIAELALAGLPALLVPYPFAADDHQAANARELEAIGAAIRLEGLGEATSGGESVVRAFDEILVQPDRLTAMSQAARTLAHPHAARDIVASCLDMLGRNSDAPRTASGEENSP
jgi:UDP-N-acetylglucosamine--N-acetylmuramyl-(pentapeptide) pyrophosphoryl-undecaprenol N-acetylglucosamine transferase